MANEFVITDIVDKQAFDQLDELAQKFGAVKQQFVDITTTIGKGISMPAGSIDEYNKKMQEFAQNGKQLEETQKKLADLQAKYEEVLKRVNDRIKARVEDESQAERMARKLAAAHQQLTDATSEEAKELAKVREATRQQNQENKTAAREALAAAEAIGKEGKSYNELSAEYSKMKAAWNNMRQSERESAAGQEMQKHLRQVREEMNEIQKQTGNYALNVGNYSNSIREALGLNSGFLGTLSSIIEKGGDASGAMGVMAGEVGGLASAVKLFLANPFGLALAAIASVVAQVAKGIKSSEENTQRWNKILAPFNAVFSVFMRYAQETAAFVLDLVEGMAKGLRVFTGWLEKVPLIGNSMKSFNKVVDESVKLQDRQNKLDLRKREVTLQNAKDQKEIARLEQEAAQIRYKNEAEYIRMREKAMELQKQISERNAEVAREQAEIMEGQNQWADNTKETNDQIAAGFAAAEQAEAQYYQSTRRDASAIASMNKTIANSVEDVAEAERKRVEAALGGVASEGSSRSVALNKLYEQQLDAEAKRYRDGEISYKEYQDRTSAMAQQYAEQSLQITIDTLTAQLDVEGITAEKRLEIEQKLTDKKLELQRKLREYSVQMQKESEDAEAARLEADIKAQEEFGRKVDEQYKEIIQQQQELVDEALNTLGQLINGIASIISAAYEKQLERLDDNLEAEQEKYDRMAESGAMSTEEAEARKRAAEEETERKREEIQKKQAQAEKAANVASTVMNTAVAIMKAWSQGGIFAAPMVALIAAQGAIQLATILATKAYAKGTDYAAGGLSVVGDGGRRELVLGAHGAWLTPDTPTLVNLHRGDKVLPDAEAALNNRRLMSDYGLLAEQARREEGLTIHVDGAAEQVKEQEATNAKLEEIRRLMRKQGRDNAYRYIYARV